MLLKNKKIFVFVSFSLILGSIALLQPAAVSEPLLPPPPPTASQSSSAVMPPPSFSEGGQPSAAKLTKESEGIPITSAEQMIEDKSKSEEKVFLNFEDTSLANVINYLAEQQKLNIVPHKNLAPIKVSVTTRNPFSLSRAWNIVYTLLEMNNFAIIKVNDLYRIVPSNQAGQEPLPLYSLGTGTNPEDLPDTEEVIRYIYTFKNVPVAEMQKVLSTMLAPNSMQINSDLETCIITDNSQRIKSAMSIAKKLDVGGLRQSIKIVNLHYANPSYIATLFSSLIDQQGVKKGIDFYSPEAAKKQTNYFAPGTKVIPAQLRNSLILLGTEENMNKIIAFIRKHLDVPPQKASSRLHTKDIKYASAQQIKTFLERIIKAPSGKKDKSGMVGEFKYFEDVIIAADEATGGEETQGSSNRLIISCGKDDWARLEPFIDKVDKPHPQVALEVMIVDIASDRTWELGAQLRNKLSMLGGGVEAATNHISAVSGSLPLSSINLIGVATTQGATGGLYSTATLGNAQTSNIWGVLKALLASNNANIVSQPFLVVNNGEDASLDVTKTLQVAGSINDPSNVAGGARVRQTVPMKATTSVVLTPRINSAGIVNLSIKISINEFQTQNSSLGQPKTNDRKLNTHASMLSGEVLVLGGLTQHTVINGCNKTPLFAEIPVIGNLFKDKTKEIQKNDLFVFIRPSIIKPIFEGKPDDYTELKLAYAKYQIIDVDEYPRLKDPIQRWFFKPPNASVKQSLEDANMGRYRPIDDFAQGKLIPRSVDMANDSFYKPYDHIEEENKRKLASIKKHQMPVKPSQKDLSSSSSSSLTTLYDHAMQ